jgi:Uma2 family endonuclease
MNIIARPGQTVEEALPVHGDALYEIIDGQYVEMPPMSSSAVRIASVLLAYLETFARTNRLGRAVAEMLFPLSLNEKTRRRPDVAFVSYTKWPKDHPLPDTDPWLVVPELAVEVVSPNDSAEELRVRVAEYLKIGVLIVWVVYPKPGVIDIFQASGGLQSLTGSDELDGGNILPGFLLPLTSVFETAADNGTPNPA